MNCLHYELFASLLTIHCNLCYRIRGNKSQFNSIQLMLQIGFCASNSIPSIVCGLFDCRFNLYCAFGWCYINCTWYRLLSDSFDFAYCYQSLYIVFIKDVVVVFILTYILIKEPVPVLQEPSSMISQDFIPLLAY